MSCSMVFGWEYGVEECVCVNFMFLTRKLAGRVKYIVFGAFFHNGERKKINETR